MLRRSACSERADTGFLNSSNRAGNELVPPQCGWAVVDKNVCAVVLFDLDGRGVPHEPAVVTSAYARNQHPFSGFHGDRLSSVESHAGSAVPDSVVGHRSSFDRHEAAGAVPLVLGCRVAVDDPYEVESGRGECTP